MTNKKNNATCSICGKGYYMCQSCKDQSRLHPWKIHTDTSKHFKIFQIVRGYSIKIYTKAEAKNKLQAVDLSDMKDFLPNIKSIIEAILAEDIPEDNTDDENKIDNVSKKSKKYKSRGTNECR